VGGGVEEGTVGTVPRPFRVSHVSCLCSFFQGLVPGVVLGKKRPDGSSYTDNPYLALEANLDDLQALLRQSEMEVQAMQSASAWDDGALFRRLGPEVDRLAGADVSKVFDPAFRTTLPTRGTPVLLVLALCPLYDCDIVTGDRLRSKTGQWMGSLLDGFQSTTSTSAGTAVQVLLKNVSPRYGAVRPSPVWGGGGGACELRRALLAEATR
jgi:hypothetical protein